MFLLGEDLPLPKNDPRSHIAMILQAMKDKGKVLISVPGTNFGCFLNFFLNNQWGCKVAALDSYPGCAESIPDPPIFSFW